MPAAFYKELKLHKWNAVFTILGVIAIIIMLGLYLIAWHPVVLGICVFLVCVFIFSQYLNHRASNNQDMTPWVVQTGCSSAEEAAERFGGSTVSDGCWVTFGSNRNHSIRLLITKQECFSMKEASRLRQTANRKINAKYGVKAEGAFYDVSRMMRVNLAVVPEENQELITWVKRTCQTLSRVEAIVNLALVTETGQLVVPKLGRGHDLHTIGSYEAGIAAVLCCLQEENVESTNL